MENFEFKTIEKEIEYTKRLISDDLASDYGKNLLYELELLLKQRNEMLEMLKELYYNQTPSREKTTRLKQLIKEATELK